MFEAVLADQESTYAIDEDPLTHWRQGDFVLAVGGFLYASTPQSGAAYDAIEDGAGIFGLIAISQSCDIVRDTGGRHYVTFCVLAQVESHEVSQIEKGRRPYLVYVENTIKKSRRSSGPLGTSGTLLPCCWEQRGN